MVELARKILRNSVFNSSRVFISGFGGFAFSVALARTLTPDLFGIYALATTVCFFIFQLDPGTGYTAVRYISYSLGRGDEASARGYFRFLLKIRLILGFVFSSLLVLISGYLTYQVFDKPELLIPLRVLAVFLFFFYLTDFLDYSSEALQNFKYPSIRHAIFEASKFAFAVPLAIWGYFNGIFIGMATATFVTFVVMIYLFNKRYKILVRGEVALIESKRVARFMSFTSIGSISGVVFTYVDTMMLGIFLPAEYAGYYRAAGGIIFGIASIAVISGVLFPALNQLEGESLVDAFKKAFRYSSILTFPFAVILALFSDEIIKIIYGVEYLPAALPLMILSPIIVFNSLNFFAPLFGAKERPELGTLVSIISMIMNVVLNYYLIISFGLAGAAAATIISRLFSIVALGIISKKVLGIGPDAESIYKPLIASAAMFSSIYLMPEPETLVIFISEICIGITIYFVMMMLIGGIKREDINYIKTIFGI